MIRNRQAVAPVGLQPVLFNVQQQNRPAACAPPPAGTGNNRTSGSTVVLLSCLIIIIITIVICAMVFIFFGANFEEDVSCSLRLHKFFKVNSVQEACTKCFAIYILRFEILQTTWRNKTKSIKILREHSHMRSDGFWIFLTYLPTLIRYFTTLAYLVRSYAALPN